MSMCTVNEMADLIFVNGEKIAKINSLQNYPLYGM